MLFGVSVRRCNQHACRPVAFAHDIDKFSVEPPAVGAG